ncbi:MAG: 2-oxoacid:acceptor oxidoreductase family protein, partial [Planctomycetaceae bacterium]|nr:2-oxoacid:acceptor oxidoreductase family protein [Planctomycetaceae bacterium]
VTASTGGTPYPDIDENTLKQYFPRLVYLDAVELATELGNAKAANTLLLGAMSAALKLPEEAWYDAVRKSVKPKFVDVNIQAFRKGRALPG